jgi:hypothetical protein
MMEYVDYIEHYVLADIDGDGIAERRLICTSGDQIIRNEVLPGLPIAAWSPFRMPHSATGRSLADRIVDLQRVRTAILRGIMDNTYMVNAGGRYEAVTNQVNMDDLLTTRPGGIVRVKSAGMLRNIPVDYIGDKTMAVMQMVERMKSQRTGINDHKQGLNAERLHETAAMSGQLLERMDALGELQARNYAEFCLKPCFAGILDLTVRHQDGPKQVRVAGEVLEIDPSMFRDHYALRVKVGTGRLRKQEKQAALDKVNNIKAGQADAS